MNPLDQLLGQLVTQAQADFAAAPDAAALENAKAKYLGKTGQITEQMKGLGKLAPEERKVQGAIINVAKEQIENALTARRNALANAQMQARLNAEAIDVTLPGRGRGVGGIHPVMRSWQRVEEIFRSIGFDVADGPEIETDWTNFTALNSPENHPARSMQDTFYIDPVERHLVLRTQTSPVQMRSMLTRDLPVYVVSPGRVYRADEFDATHLPVFSQFEGLVIDKGITMAHLRGTLDHVARALFGAEAKTRLRANFFPFTEPSAELDLWHPTFKGGARWIEWGGCGMVNPNVLRSAGIDPEEYSGFAFGMGIERTLMFRSDVKDMRDMAEGDVRFSEQYGMVV